MFAFAGLGFLVSVGYMDPGNWATDLAAGSAFGYQLLFVVLVSSVMAMFLQYLALKLGVATDGTWRRCGGLPRRIPQWVNRMLWIVAELAIAATDLAEVLCFVYELIKSKPDMGKVMVGYLPTLRTVTDPAMLYIATGILGATVMPHNLYLHSSVIQTRAYPRTAPGRRMAIQLGALDSTLSLILAFMVNSAILILAASAFHYGNPPRDDVADIGDAYALLATSLGAKAASILFGVALLAAGQNSTITGTLSGQIVMEGTAIIPAAIVAAVMGREGVAELLVLSQVILSLTLPFAVFPLVHFTSSSRYLASTPTRYGSNGMRSGGGVGGAPRPARVPA
ncbi:hypothetical protein HYH03_019103 [Edaphochlamys debaryana]|uniref:Uncharacterized protein n=1 Tax=Edaphochlamys debaryana TaxID=47281 RepID=A0A835XCL2_9CHLO|nr:hypothetical protein HYH03_019103 [Edaphochlamys debaryana]|eukprot:KAG2481937.1 hypothetical protein HYH03_019103 [Edaphochlamys debaryana]